MLRVWIIVHTVRRQISDLPNPMGSPRRSIGWGRGAWGCVGFSLAGISIRDRLDPSSTTPFQISHLDPSHLTRPIHWGPPDARLGGNASGG